MVGKNVEMAAALHSMAATTRCFEGEGLGWMYSGVFSCKERDQGGELTHLPSLIL